MAYRGRGRRGPARKSSKPSMTKAKKMITKSHKKAAKKNMDTYFLKTKMLFTVLPVQGVTVANYVSYSATLSPVGGAYMGNAEFNLYKLQYDQFRVNSVTIHVKPKANVLDLVNAQSEAKLTLAGDNLVHTCIDRDGLANTNISQISRYPSYKAYSILKPFSRTFAVKYPVGNWLDCQNPSGSPLISTLGLSGSINLYAENIMEDTLEVFNEPWAQITVEHNIVFRGKTSNNMSATYDAEGNVIGVSITQSVDEEQKLPSPVINIRGGFVETDDVITPEEVPVIELAKLA